MTVRTIRQYVPAYRADNGNVIPIGSTTVSAHFAEIEAESLRSPEDETEVFVAYRDLPVWQPVHRYMGHGDVGRTAPGVPSVATSAPDKRRVRWAGDCFSCYCRWRSRHSYSPDRRNPSMAACDECWDRAFTVARRTGRSQVEVYRELVAENPEHDPGDELT